MTRSVVIKEENQMIETKKTDICRECGGNCCKTSGCECSPNDFKKSKKAMKKALKSGNYSIDFRCKINEYENCFTLLENGEKTLNMDYIKASKTVFFYIRARNVNAPVLDIFRNKEKKVEGPCVLWQEEKGCKLCKHNRPRVGREMVPGIDCGHFGDEHAVIAFMMKNLKWMIQEWQPYKTFLLEMAIKYYDPNWKLNIKNNFIL